MVSETPVRNDGNDRPFRNAIAAVDSRIPETATGFVEIKEVDTDALSDEVNLKEKAVFSQKK